VIERPAELVGTVLTGYGWQTYYVTPDGDLFVHVGDTATANAAPPQLLGRYASVELARAVARHRLRRDVQLASEDMRVACADIATLIRAQCPTPDWCRGSVCEAPVTAATTRRSLPSLIRAARA
jgi:hypothetical protein